MESWFVALASVSLFFTWASGGKIADLQQGCNAGPKFKTTASRNAQTLASAPLAPFGRPEQGWQVYAPQMAATIGTGCAPDTNRFAASLATWQARNQLPPTGAVDAPTLATLKQRWQKARPFIAAFEPGRCPPAASDEQLAKIKPAEGWLGKEGKLDARALSSLRRMVAAARAADPRIAIDRHMLTIVSSFRSPEYDAARCAGGRCNGIAKARCSAHRTGTAVDLYVGAAPGHGPVDSSNDNRLYLSRTPAYRWLVANARRFGFVNYVFEPWHWEWVGERG
ncbi:MAG: D-alanyl-D-alanine carboxypeptidase family protein [Micropepsaceae bacterium]